jgi:hypothetical protein
MEEVGFKIRVQNIIGVRKDIADISKRLFVPNTMKLL